MTDVYVVEVCYDYEGCNVLTARGSLESASEDAHKVEHGDGITISRFNTATGDGTIVLNLERRWGDDGLFWEEVQ